jgi:hypothetical protein
MTRVGKEGLLGRHEVAEIVPHCSPIHVRTAASAALSRRGDEVADRGKKRESEEDLDGYFRST